jgi:hypothetical protein
MLIIITIKIFVHHLLFCYYCRVYDSTSLKVYAIVGIFVTIYMWINLDPRTFLRFPRVGF